MPTLANASHELFAQKWHETENKSEAYRVSHPRSLKWKDTTVHVKACELSKNGKIVVRYNELKEAAAIGHGITIESLLIELDEARAAALGCESPQSSAAVSATMSKAKLVGLDINRTVTVEMSHEEWLDSLS